MINTLKSQLGSSLESVRRFFGRPIRLQRGHLTLGAPAGSLRARARDAQRRRVRHMRRDLYQLMQHHPGARKVMPHLDATERTLRRRGLTGIEALPVSVIAKALTQLEQLVRDWTPVGLANLRSRMAVIVKYGSVEGVREAGVHYPFGLNTAAHGDVMTDLGLNELAAFAEMERSWAGQVPAAVAHAVAASAASPLNH